MKKIVLNLLKNPFFAGSIVMVLGSNFANAINYIYHTLMGRLLGPSSYGELSAILSIINLLGIVVASVSLVTTKFVSSAKSESEIISIVSWIGKRISILSITTMIIILVFSRQISDFLHLSTNLLAIIMSFIFVFTFPTNLYRAILQGSLKFNKAVISLTVENVFKLFAGIFLVLIGYSVLGALLGILLSSIIAFAISRYYVTKYLVSSQQNFKESKRLVSYSFPVIVQSLTFASLISADLVLVKHFFDTYTAGLYASVSTLGKIIFFAVGPIASVMFPMVSQKKSKGEPYKKIFVLSLSLALLISFMVEAVFILSPEVAIKSLFGSAYLQVSNLLVIFGVFIILYTLSYLFINFFLSIGKTKVVLLPLIAALIQIAGILIFHSALLHVIYVSIFSTFILFLSLVFYYFYFKDDVIH